jgi:polysaccharide export outer membrane protein
MNSRRLISIAILAAGAMCCGGWCGLAAQDTAASVSPTSALGGKYADGATRTARSASSENGTPYRIGVDDVLTISVWHEPDLSRTVPVRPDGQISLPLVGDISAAGKTAVELQGELRAALAKFVKDPEVNVIVSDIRSQRINIIGQVSKPGTYPLTQAMGVLDAVAQAGGLKDFAKKNNIYVLRVMPDGRRLRIKYSYQAVLKGGKNAQELMLQAHDTVVVP